MINRAIPAVAVCVLVCASLCDAATYKFREGGGTGFADVSFDDTYLTGGSDATYGDETNVLVRDSVDSNDHPGLMAAKDMFSLLPPEYLGNSLVVQEAILRVYRYQGLASDVLRVYRCTSDWLPGAAGQNENDVSFLHREVSASANWSGSSFGAGDYDTSIVATGQWSDVYNGEIEIDITSVMQALYDSGQDYGLVLLGPVGGNVLTFRSSERSEVALRPQIEISYNYGAGPMPTYQLTVNSGSGTGAYEQGEIVNISADTPPSGLLFREWIGQTEYVTDDSAADTTLIMPALAAAVTATFIEDPALVDWYPEWSAFCVAEFGAENEPLVYDMLGQDLEFLSGGDWVRASRSSASIGFETNLPASAAVEYGPTASYGSQIDLQPGRHTYVHLACLGNLAPGQTYHYRIVAEDERGNVIATTDRTFYTSTPSGVIYVPGSMSGPPYVLNQAGKTYILTEDVVADRTAFDITANDITLDLGGHTVTYNEEDYQVIGDFPQFVAESSFGVKGTYRSNIKVFNGTIVQGAGNNAAHESSVGYSPVYFQSTSGEIAGVTVEYQGSQLTGLATRYCSGMNVHHNVVLDHGGELSNRHMGVQGIWDAGAAHHNLILRARQRGIMASNNSNYYNNEIYIDSCATNSFGIMYYSGANSAFYDNKVFGAGYLMVGVGTVSGSSDIEVYDNLIHVEGIEPDNRWPEYGAQSGAYCVRLTWGGDNINYHDNYMISYGRDEGMVRGTWFYAGPDVIDLVCRGNLIKAVLTNELSTVQGAIVHCGDGVGSDDQPIIYENNRVISNFCNVRLGESYGTGSNARLYGNTFVNEGPVRSDYRTIQIGNGTADSYDNEFWDSLFEGGASYDEVDFVGTGPRDFSVGWTVTIATEPLADVVVEDAFGAEVFSGAADGAGIAAAKLVEYVETVGGRTYHTDHTATVSKDGRQASQTFTADAIKTVQIPIGGISVPGDLNDDGFVGQGDLDIVLDAWGDTVSPGSQADPSGDGFVGQADLDIVLDHWGEGQR